MLAIKIVIVCGVTALIILDALINIKVKRLDFSRLYLQLTMYMSSSDSKIIYHVFDVRERLVSGFDLKIG